MNAALKTKIKNITAKVASVKSRIRWPKRRQRSCDLQMLESSVRLFKILEYASAVSVVACVLCESWPAYSSAYPTVGRFRALGAVLPGIGVAVSIALEVLFSMMVSRTEGKISDLAKQETAKALKAAAEAALETERLKQQAAWRVIQPMQMAQLTFKLKEKLGAVWIDYCMGDFESQYLGQQLQLIFGAAGGWKTALRSITPTTLRFGILISDPAAPNARACDSLVLDALKGCGIPFAVGNLPPVVGQSMRFGSMDDASALIAGRIFVGPKFPPMPEIHL